MTVSNFITLLRGPLAFFFLIQNTNVRIAVLALAVVTDVVDGFLARWSKTTSQFGAALDPIMDKFFVYVVLSVFYFEHDVHVWQGFAMISRDFFVLLFGVYLLATKRWHTYEFISVRFGKISTALQFLVILLLLVGFTVPLWVYYLFIAFGFLTGIELLYRLFRPYPRH